MARDVLPQRQSAPSGRCMEIVNDKVLEQSRKKCWLARDAYFACAAQHSDRSCWRARRAYTAACPASWVAHFDKKRAEAARVAALLEKQSRVQERE